MPDALRLPVRWHGAPPRAPAPPPIPGSRLELMRVGPRGSATHLGFAVERRRDGEPTVMQTLCGILTDAWMWARYDVTPGCTRCLAAPIPGEGLVTPSSQGYQTEEAHD